MMKYIYILVLLCGFAVSMHSQSVGINTTNPMRPLHIDPQGNNDAGGAAIFDEDVVITDLGNLAIGSNTAPANAKVTIASGSNFRMMDGSQFLGRSLVSDANGNATWRTIVGANGFFEGRIRINDTANSVAWPGGENTLPGGTYTAPVDGLYFFDIRYWVQFNLTAHVTIAHHIRVKNKETDNGVNTIPLDEYEGYTTSSTEGEQGIGFFTSLSTYLLKDQEVKFNLRISGAVGTLVPFSRDNPFEIIVKRYNSLPE